MPDLSEDDPFYEFFRRFGQVPPVRAASSANSRRSRPARASSSAPTATSSPTRTSSTAPTKSPCALTDKREFKAKVIGADKRTDIALLKIEAKDLPKVTIGDPDKLKVGEWVVAIGKPFGLENTMTAGIVSAKGRDLPQENLVPFIQTDVAINPGNSGGPLFNMRGEVVGINSLIYSRTGGYMGLAFAIPIDVAMNTVEPAAGKGPRHARPHRRADPGGDQGRRRSVRPRRSRAARWSTASRRTAPAAKAGVEIGDIIIKVDGRDVKSSNDLPRIISAVRPGTKITLTVWRKGAQKDIAVTVAEMKEDVASAQPRRGNAGAEGKGEAQPDGPRAVRPDRRAEEGSSRSRAACWSRTSRPSCAATSSRAT